MLALLLINTQINEYFVGSILFWILSIGSLIFAFLGVLGAIYVLYDEYNNQ